MACAVWGRLVVASGDGAAPVGGVSDVRRLVEVCVDCWYWVSIVWGWSDAYMTIWVVSGPSFEDISSG